MEIEDLKGELARLQQARSAASLRGDHVREHELGQMFQQRSKDLEWLESLGDYNDTPADPPRDQAPDSRHRPKIKGMRIVAEIAFVIVAVVAAAVSAYWVTPRVLY